MIVYKNGMTMNGRTYRLYGYEGNICIWEDANRTQFHQRTYYANSGKPIFAHTVGEIRKAIKKYLEASE